MLTAEELALAADCAIEHMGLRTKPRAWLVAALLLFPATSTAAALLPKLPHQLIKLILQDVCSTGCSESDRAEYKRSLRFERHDLNRDGIPEFFVYIDHRDLCGAGFNCTFWVFQNRKNGYRLLASHPVIRPRKTVTNRYRDLESRGRMGGCTLPNGNWGREVYVTLFKYTGAEYQPTVLGAQCREDKKR